MSMITVWRKPRERKFPKYKDYSEEDRERLALCIYNHYKEIGFPYFPTDKLWRYGKFHQLQRTEYISLLEEDKSIRQTMVGLSLAWSYTVSYTHLTLPTSYACRSRWSPYH